MIVDTLDLDSLPVGICRLWVEVVRNAFGQPECVPVLVAKGRKPGKVVGLTAAVHGDELNGISTIHRLFDRLDCNNMRGSVVGVAVVNHPGFMRGERRFVDGKDLNHTFPGTPTGSVSDVYAYRLVQRIIRRFDVLLDLHTASFGRVNSLYVRADMTEPTTARMAFLQRPQVIVHNPPADRTLRGAAAALGIPAITVEIGDPNRFQHRYIRRTLVGVRAVLMELGVVAKRHVAEGGPPIICSDSHWVYTDGGGLLTVLPKVTDLVAEGEEIAHLVDIFGDPVATYRAPHYGVVIGHSIEPVARTGARILHIGRLATEADTHILGREDGAVPVMH
ncbi:MAG: succinylglutamate desuccinylase/aspartoacylase family protein [Myxococcota bacterium]